MKLRKYLLLLILLVITNSSIGRTALLPVSKPVVDTLIPTPDTTLRKLVIAAEQSNQYKIQIEILEGREILLQKLVASMEEKYKMQEDYYKGQLANQRMQLEMKDEQIQGYESINKRLTRQLKVQKIITKGSVLVVAGLLVKIFLVK